MDFFLYGVTGWERIHKDRQISEAIQANLLKGGGGKDPKRKDRKDNACRKKKRHKK